jgi:hypothetical protein
MKIIDLRKGFVIGHQGRARRNGMGGNLHIHVAQALA